MLRSNQHVKFCLPSPAPPQCPFPSFTLEGKIKIDLTVAKRFNSSFTGTKAKAWAEAQGLQEALLFSTELRAAGCSSFPRPDSLRSHGARGPAARPRGFLRQGKALSCSPFAVTFFRQGELSSRSKLKSCPKCLPKVRSTNVFSGGSSSLQACLDISQPAHQKLNLGHPEL